jgi:hypothetical protein
MNEVLTHTHNVFYAFFLKSTKRKGGWSLGGLWRRDCEFYLFIGNFGVWGGLRAAGCSGLAWLGLAWLGLSWGWNGDEMETGLRRGGSDGVSALMGVAGLGRRGHGEDV